VPSRALQQWLVAQDSALSQLEVAHAAVGGTGVGRRTATQQINDAYIVLTAALFQRYCRDVHTEAVALIVAAVDRPAIGDLVSASLLFSRQLDRGNATAGSIGADFSRLGLAVWDLLQMRSPRTIERRRHLDQLNIWRNAIAHQDFALGAQATATVGTSRRTLVWARKWRASCVGLAHARRGGRGSPRRDHWHGALAIRLRRWM